MAALEFGFSALLFVLSSGALFKRRFADKPVAIALVALLAIASSVTLLWPLVGIVKGLLSNGVSARAPAKLSATGSEQANSSPPGASVVSTGRSTVENTKAAPLNTVEAVADSEKNISIDTPDILTISQYPSFGVDLYSSKFVITNRVSGRTQFKMTFLLKSDLDIDMYPFLADDIFSTPDIDESGLETIDGGVCRMSNSVGSTIALFRQDNDIDNAIISGRWPGEVLHPGKSITFSVVGYCLGNVLDNDQLPLKLGVYFINTQKKPPWNTVHYTSTSIPVALGRNVSPSL